MTAGGVHVNSGGYTACVYGACHKATFSWLDNNCIYKLWLQFLTS